MPLLKRKPYDLSSPPDNLKPKELVFQVPVTKEIFRDYEEYLKRINLYRQRVWTCKYTGKINLTYEEALQSEHKATEQVQQFPKEFMGPVLHLVQFSMLRMDDLVSTILKTFKDRFVVDEEILCVKENITRPCKVIKVHEVQNGESNSYNYEVELLDENKNVIGTSVEASGNLMRKKAPPFTRALVKSFIRDSVKDNANRNSQTPLVVLEKLCQKYGITTEPPEELKKFFVNKPEPNVKDVDITNKRPLTEDTEAEKRPTKKAKKNDVDENNVQEEKNKDTKSKSKGGQDDKNKDNKSKTKGGQEDKSKDKNKSKNTKEENNGGEDKKTDTSETVVKVIPIKYPIEDTLVQPSPDEPPLPPRPVPSFDFPLPMDSVGRLLMVWNFCSLFGKVVRLSPFSLEELEKAIECKETDSVLLKETHHAFVKLILTDPNINESFEEKRNRKTKVTINTWKEDLSDLLNLEDFENLAMHSETIAKGNYCTLESSVKLEILSQLVDWSLSSTAIREQLDIYIEEKQAIAAQKRKEEMEEAKRGKEAQEKLKQAQIADGNHDASNETALHDEKDTKVEDDDENDNDEAEDEGNDSEGNSDNEELVSEKDKLANGSYENGSTEGTTPSGRSRQLALKLKAEQKQAEEIEKEKRRIEEQKRVQEKRKAQLEAIKERKLQEKKMIELHKRQEQLEREIEKRVIRTNPLGRDKDHNRYWFFPREGRIFVEDPDSTRWGFYSSKEELEGLFGSLNTKGIREKALHRQIEKHYSRISDAFQKRNKDIAQRHASEDASVRRSSRGKTTAPQQTMEVTYKNKFRST